MKSDLEIMIISLWHISRTALAGMPTVPTRCDRMSYVKRELNRLYPSLIVNMTQKQVWFKIEEILS